MYSVYSQQHFLSGGHLLCYLRMCHAVVTGTDVVSTLVDIVNVMNPEKWSHRLIENYATSTNSGCML
jgi:hypothetical protein